MDYKIIEKVEDMALVETSKRFWLFGFEEHRIHVSFLYKELNASRDKGFPEFKFFCNLCWGKNHGVDNSENWVLFAGKDDISMEWFVWEINELVEILNFLKSKNEEVQNASSVDS